MTNAAQAFALDEETTRALENERQDEIKNPMPDEPERPAPSVTVEKETAPEAKDDRPRNPDGTFAKTEAEKPAPKAVEKAVDTPKETKAPEGYVPHGALHEERARRKEQEKKIEAMEKRWAELVEKMQKTPAAPPPDPNQDFPGHVQHHFNQFQQRTE